MKRFLFSLSLLITGFSINFDSKAAIITATSSGNWDSPFTWNFGVPQCGDTVIIPAGYTVTVSVNVNLDNGSPLCPLFRMTISGNLRFTRGKKMNLASGACISVEAGGTISPSAKGGGSSEAIYIGPDRVWQASGGTLNGVASLGCAILLPVELVDFTVVENGNQTQFNWQVASETNLSNYNIDYSENGKEWINLASVAKIPYDDVSSDKKYEFFSRSFQETLYFRLSSVDNDGKNSPLRIVRFQFINSLPNTLCVVPNPSKVGELVSLAYQTSDEQQTTIKIVDQRGLIIYTYYKIETSKDGLVIFDTSVLTSGTYFVSISNKNQSLKSKLAVL